jgi:hypothetical protein
VNVIASALRRHAEPTKFLNIAVLSAWASPTVRLHRPRPTHELNQALSNPGFSIILRSQGVCRRRARRRHTYEANPPALKVRKRQTFLLYTPLRRYLWRSLLMHVVVWGLLRRLRTFRRALAMTCYSYITAVLFRNAELTKFLTSLPFPRGHPGCETIQR